MYLKRIILFGNPLLYAGHGIYLDGESPSWGLSSQ